MSLRGLLGDYEDTSPKNSDEEGEGEVGKVSENYTPGLQLPAVLTSRPKAPAVPTTKAVTLKVLKSVSAAPDVNLGGADQNGEDEEGDALMALVGGYSSGEGSDKDKSPRVAAVAPSAPSGPQASPSPRSDTQSSPQSQRLSESVASPVSNAKGVTPLEPPPPRGHVEIESVRSSVRVEEGGGVDAPHAISASTLRYPLTSLPPAPQAPCNPTLQGKVRKQLSKPQKGRSLLQKMVNSHTFQNPYTLEKQANFLGIDEKGSVLASVEAIQRLDRTCYYRVLGEKQKRVTEQRSSNKRTNIGFESVGTGRPKTQHVIVTAPAAPVTSAPQPMMPQPLHSLLPMNIMMQQAFAAAQLNQGAGATGSSYQARMARISAEKRHGVQPQK